MKNNISYWSSSVKFKDYPRLEGEVSVDAAIIGGGMAGICAAYMLKSRGLKVAVLDANKIGQGNTANTTAKITWQHDLCYDRLINEHGAGKALLYKQANSDALEMYRKIINENNIACDLIKADSYVFATTDKYEKDIQKELKAAQKLGIEMDIVTNIELPISIRSAIRVNDQAEFHPLKFIAALCELIEGDGSFLFENTVVTEVVRDNEIITDIGHIKAKYVVIATHYPIINIPGFYFLKMYQHRTQVIAFKGKALAGGYCAAEENGFCFRSQPLEDGDLIIMDGADYKTGHAGNTTFYDIVEKAAREYFGKIDVLYRWSAQDCMPIDYLPYIGRYSKLTPNMYVTTGFAKWGMSTSMAGAEIIADLITTGKSKYEDLYNPSRFDPISSVAEFLPQLGDITINLTAGLLKLAKDKLSEIKNGEAGIVNIDKHRVGLYKDENGKEYAVNATCAHLGCALAFNNDEQTWDCPCHGSRYDINGKALEAPTVRPIDRLEIADKDKIK